MLTDDRRPPGSHHRSKREREYAPSAGPAYDLTLTEVRDQSMVVEWKKPLYAGSGPITGYHVEYCKTGSSEWTTATETAVHQRFFKVINVS